MKWKLNAESTVCLPISPINCEHCSSFGLVCAHEAKISLKLAQNSLKTDSCLYARLLLCFNSIMLSISMIFYRILGRTLLTLCLIVPALSTVKGAVDDCGEIGNQIGHGEIRWDESAIYVQGTAAPNLAQKNLTMIKRGASRAARMDAYRKAAAVLAGVSLTASSKVGDLPGATSRVSGFIRGATLCKSKFYADGGVDLVLRIPMASVYANLKSDAKAASVSTGASEYSGLIVDVRHLPFVPAIVPTLASTDGFKFLEQSSAINQLPVKYVYSDASTLLEEVAGKKPLKVSAVSLGLFSPSEIVLEASAIDALKLKPEFLGQGRTVIIMRKPKEINCKEMTVSITETKVDWVRRLILTRGYGEVDFSSDYDQAVKMRLMERAAEVDAERRLTTEAIDLSTNRELKGSISVLVNAARCGAKYFKDGKAEVVLAAPLDQLVLPIPWASKTATPEAHENNTSTGVIIDARQLQGFMPTLAPVLIGPSGELLYGSEFVQAAYGRTFGGAGYVENLEAAIVDERIGFKPLVLKPLKHVEGQAHVLQFSTKDAERIQMLAARSDVLARAAIVIVLPLSDPTSNSEAL